MAMESRLERHLMRHRGGAAREIKSAHFAFTIETVNKPSPIPATSLPTAYIRDNDALGRNRIVGSTCEKVKARDVERGPTDQPKAVKIRGRPRKMEATLRTAPDIDDTAAQENATGQQKVEPCLVEFDELACGIKKRKRPVPTCRGKAPRLLEVANDRSAHPYLEASPQEVPPNVSLGKQATKPPIKGSASARTIVQISNVRVADNLIPSMEDTTLKQTKARSTRTAISYTEPEEDDIPRVEVQPKARRSRTMKAGQQRPTEKPIFQSLSAPQSRGTAQESEQVTPKSDSKPLQVRARTESIAVELNVDVPRRSRGTTQTKRHDDKCSTPTKPTKARRRDKTTLTLPTAKINEEDELEVGVEQCPPHTLFNNPTSRETKHVPQPPGDVKPVRTTPIKKTPHKGRPLKRGTPLASVKLIDLPKPYTAKRASTKRGRIDEIHIHVSPLAHDLDDSKSDKGEESPLRKALEMRSFNLSHQMTKKAAKPTITDWEKPAWFKASMPKALVQASDPRLRFRM